MLKIDSLEDIRGNNIIMYSLKTLMNKNCYPSFSIMAGHMGVGKSSVASIVARDLNKSEYPVQTFNFGLDVNMKELEEVVFKMSPAKPRAFIFEELHGLEKAQQTALLTMLDKQPKNVYIIATTTELYKILGTIRSRATVWEFKLLSAKQLSQLLDDYLDSIGKKMASDAKSALLKSCYGVPRDLLKSVDLALAGDFTGDQLNELTGQVSEDMIFTLLCSLKSTSVDFALNVSSLIGESTRDKLKQLRDFYTRFLLERKGIEGGTLTKDKITLLNSIFTSEELTKIGRTLIRATPDTLGLELSLLNMDLNKVSGPKVVGQQIDRLATHQSTAVSKDTKSDMEGRKVASRVTQTDLGKLHLTSKKDERT